MIFNWLDVFRCLLIAFIFLIPQIIIILKNLWKRINYHKINKLENLLKTPLSEKMSEKLNKELSRRQKLDEFFYNHLDTVRELCKENCLHFIFVILTAISDAFVVVSFCFCLICAPVNYFTAKNLPNKKANCVEQFYEMEYPSFEQIKKAEELNGWQDELENRIFLTDECVEKLRNDKIDTIKMMAHIQNKVDEEIVKIAGESN